MTGGKNTPPAAGYGWDVDYSITYAAATLLHPGMAGFGKIRQSSRKILETDYCYVDKTGLPLRLVQEGTYSFLSRPRRLGKALTSACPADVGL